MSAGGSADGAAAGAVSSTMLLAVGIVGGLLCIYLSGFLGDLIGPVIAGLGAVCAIIWGADAIRRVASYGLGTGVPSIGYMSLSVGVISALAGLSLAGILKMAILGPVASFVVAVIIGAIIAIVATKIVGMKIPIMLQCTIEIAGAATLSILGFAVAIAGSYDMTAILDNVVATGFIAVLFIMCTMAIQHPFNACLGPNERRSSKNSQMCSIHCILINDSYRSHVTHYWWYRLVCCIHRWFNRLDCFIQSICISFL